jgi:glycosyltransferase involved in cell wall biosynthesis
MVLTESHSERKTAIALVYWGRLGAGAALMSQIAEAMERDARFTLYLSPSLQSELPPAFPAARLLPVRTFTGPVSLLPRTLLLPLTARRLVRNLAAAKVEAIVTVMPHIWGLALQRAAARAGIRTFLVVHDADPHPGETRPLFDWLVRREIRGSDRIVTFSDHVANRLVALGLATESRLARLFHPVFRFAGAEAEATHPAKPFRLLFFGRILPYKGVAKLLEAYAKLRADGVDCTLRIVGRGQIGAPPALMEQPGLSIVTGWVAPDAIGGILADADAIALPYLEASQSGVIAAAYGVPLPVVATPVGGLAEQMIDGETGVLAGSVSAEDFAAAVRRLIATPGLYEHCRAGAARYAETHSLNCFARVLGDAVLAAVPDERRPR